MKRSVLIVAMVSGFAGCGTPLENELAQVARWQRAKATTEPAPPPPLTQPAPAPTPPTLPTPLSGRFKNLTYDSTTQELRLTYVPDSDAAVRFSHLEFVSCNKSNPMTCLFHPYVLTDGDFCGTGELVEQELIIPLPSSLIAPVSVEMRSPTGSCAAVGIGVASFLPPTCGE